MSSSRKWNPSGQLGVNYDDYRKYSLVHASLCSYAIQLHYLSYGYGT